MLGFYTYIVHTRRSVSLNIPDPACSNCIFYLWFGIAFYFSWNKFYFFVCRCTGSLNFAVSTVTRPVLTVLSNVRDAGFEPGTIAFSGTSSNFMRNSNYVLDSGQCSAYFLSVVTVLSYSIYILTFLQLYRTLYWVIKFAEKVGRWLKKGAV